MKKVLLSIIAIIITVSLIAGCSNNQPASEPDQTVMEPKQNVSEPKTEVSEPEQGVPSEPTVSEDTPKTIYRDTSGRRWLRVGLAMHSCDGGPNQLTYMGIQKYFSTLDTDTIKYDLVMADGKNDASKQIKQIDKFIEEKYDVIIADLWGTFMVSEITEKAKAADIPVVYIWREPSEKDMNAWDKLCFVGIDDRQAGTVQGEIVANLSDNGDIDGDGIVRYVMITGDPKNIDTEYRTELPIKVLTDRGIEVEELFKQNADWSNRKGNEVATSALERFRNKVDIIFCNNDAMALGAFQAIEAAGRTVNKDIYLLGIDALDEAVDMIIMAR